MSQGDIRMQGKTIGHLYVSSLEKDVARLEIINAELLEALNEMVVAMRLYQMDFDEEPPYRHRAMMERAEAIIAKYEIVKEPS